MKSKGLIGIVVIVLCLGILGCSGEVGESRFAPLNWNNKSLQGMGLTAFDVLIESEEDFFDEDGPIEINAITYGDGKFLAGGSASGYPVTWYSGDGAETWKEHSAVLEEDEISGFFKPSHFGSIDALGFGNGVFAAGVGSEGLVSFSSDGVDWKFVEDSNERKTGIESFIYANGITIAYVGASHHDYKLIDNPTGYNYFDITINSLEYDRQKVYGITSDGNLFYGVASWEVSDKGYTAIVSSTNGKDWSTIGVTEDDENYGLISDFSNSRLLYSGGNVLLGAGSNQSEGDNFPIISYSTNQGNSWAAAEFLDDDLGDRSFVTRIIYGHDFFVALGLTGDYSTGTSKIWYSGDKGKTWNLAYALNATEEEFIDVAYGEGIFVVLGYSGKIYYAAVK